MASLDLLSWEVAEVIQVLDGPPKYEGFLRDSSQATVFIEWMKQLAYEGADEPAWLQALHQPSEEFMWSVCLRPLPTVLHEYHVKLPAA